MAGSQVNKLISKAGHFTSYLFQCPKKFLPWSASLGCLYALWIYGGLSQTVKCVSNLVDVTQTSQSNTFWHVKSRSCFRLVWWCAERWCISSAYIPGAISRSLVVCKQWIRVRTWNSCWIRSSRTWWTHNSVPCFSASAYVFLTFDFFGSLLFTVDKTMPRRKPSLGALFRNVINHFYYWQLSRFW